MLAIMEQSDGIGRIANDCFNWFAGRHSDDSGCRRLAGEVRFDCVTSNEHRATIHPSAPLQNYARVADALIAVEQIHLLGGYFPLAIELAEAVTRPAAKRADFIVPEFADDEIRAHHALIASADTATENFDVCNKP
jgi:hypothetical protein